MASKVANLPSPSEVRRSDLSRITAKAEVRFSDSPEILARKQQVGDYLNTARAALKWNLDELAAAVDRDPRLVKRWLAGDDNPPLHVLLSVPALWEKFVIAQAKDLPSCRVNTLISFEEKSA